MPHPPRSRAGWRAAHAVLCPHWAAGLLVVLALALTACNAGSYLIDIFPEMHYAPSQRRLEPERLPPPAGAVPVTGARPAYTWAQASGLANPLPRSVALLDRARRTYAVNCATCHGADGHGQSPMAAYFAAAGVVPPVDLASPRVQGRTDGELYWIVANGLGGMPPFGDLLADDDLWTIVRVIRDTRGP